MILDIDVGLAVVIEFHVSENSIAVYPLAKR